MAGYSLSDEEVDTLLRASSVVTRLSRLDRQVAMDLIARGFAVASNDIVRFTPYGMGLMRDGLIARLNEEERSTLRRVQNSGAKESVLRPVPTEKLLNLGLAIRKNGRVYLTIIGRACALLLDQTRRNGADSNRP